MKLVIFDHEVNATNIFEEVNTTSTTFLDDDSNTTFSPSTLFPDEPLLLVSNDTEMPAERILPRISAFISLLAICCVAVESFLDLQGRRVKTSSNSTRAANANTISHILLWYQVALFGYCLAFLLASTPAPVGQSIWGAYGNQATCTAAGFLFQFSLYAGIGWDAALSTTYWSICRNRPPWKRVWHVLIWPFALAVSLYPLTTDLYNYNHTVCWIHEFPEGCHLEESDQDCIRGASAVFWTNLASGIAVLHLMYSILLMIGLYCVIRRLENTMDQSSRRHSASMTVTTVSTTRTCSTRQHSRKIAVQGLLYTGCLVVTMLPTAIMVVLANAFNFWSNGLAVFATAMTPLVGYLNFLIFLRKRTTDQCHTRYAKSLRRIHCFGWHGWGQLQWTLRQKLAQCRGRCCCRRRQEDHGGELPSVQAMQFNKHRSPAVSRLTCSFADQDEIIVPLPPIDDDDEDQPRKPTKVVLVEETAPTERSEEGEDQPHHSADATSNGKAFKAWVSESSEFETWRSETEEDNIYGGNNNNNSATAFKAWQSQASEYETWRSELEDIQEQAPEPSTNETQQKSKEQGSAKSKNSATATPLAFKLWKSLASECETWESEVEDPQERAQQPITNETPRSKPQDNAKPSSSALAAFKLWKSQASECTTWESEVEDIQKKVQQPSTTEISRPREQGSPKSNSSANARKVFKMWKSQEETRKSELEDITENSNEASTRDFNASTSNFKTWKSELPSEFETWQTEVEEC